MSPNDPRHGKPAGYDAGCREECCRGAAAAYERQRRYDGILGKPPRTMPAVGTQRRVQALVALGYTFRDISQRLGLGHDRGRQLAVMERKFIRTTTADMVAALFDELCMTPAPEGWHASYARTVARRNGWVPPLAWDDIDDPDERPARPEKADGRKTVHKVIEDAEWLADSDASLSEVCERLDLKRDTFRDTLRRENRSDLYWRLANREPDADNRRATRDGIRRSREVA